MLCFEVWGGLTPKKCNKLQMSGLVRGWVNTFKANGPYQWGMGRLILCCTTIKQNRQGVCPACCSYR